MNESDARRVWLVRAWETAAPGQLAWSDDDRRWADRAAAEVEGAAAPTDAYIARRAALAVERLARQDRRVERTLRSVRWRPWVGWLLVLLAFASGAVSDAIGGSQRINVLAPPLLALIAWNLAVYLGLAIRGALRLFGGRATKPGPLSRWLARLAHAVDASQRSADDASAVARFLRDWARAAARLNAARIARVLHLAAAAIALGALTGMYVRGLALEYRAGWESTFLNADTVHSLLQAVLGPASRLSGFVLPDAAQLEAMRFPASAGMPAAEWIHLYAITVALVIVIPRLLLAIVDALIERRLAASFSLPLADPYFAALARMHRGEPAAVVVVPYNHPPSPQASLGLQALLAESFGPTLSLTITAAVAYGNEELAGEAAVRNAAALAIALLGLTATPETETHGVFLRTLAAGLPAGTPLLVLIDESAFVARFGRDDSTALRRRDERRQAWRQLAAEGPWQVLFVDLEHVRPASDTPALRAALDALAAEPRP